MAKNFFASRGCVYAVPTDSGKKLYNLEGFKTGGTDKSVVLLTGLELVARDLIMPVNTTVNFQVLYVFGRDFGNVQVSGEILLGADASAAKVNAVVSWFEANRVGSKSTPVKFSLGDKAFKLYLHGMILGTPDAQYNIQPFAFIGTQVGKPS